MLATWFYEHPYCNNRDILFFLFLLTNVLLVSRFGWNHLLNHLNVNVYLVRPVTESLSCWARPGIWVPGGGGGWWWWSWRWWRWRWWEEGGGGGAFGVCAEVFGRENPAEPGISVSMVTGVDSGAKIALPRSPVSLIWVVWEQQPPLLARCQYANSQLERAAECCWKGHWVTSGRWVTGKHTN